MTAAREPVWLTYARTLIGVMEIKGPKHSPTIMGWIKGLGPKILGTVVSDDETAWCGTFVAHVMTTSGIALVQRDKPTAFIVAVRAKGWLDWGRVLNAPRLGCVMVFNREGGGHVAFYLGEDATHYHVLGGNQGDKVSIMRLAKDRLAGMRWPLSVALPEAKPVWLSPNGAPASGNEA